MKQLALGILLAASLSLGYRLIGALTLDANDLSPAPVPEAPEELDEENAIQLAAVHLDPPTLERTQPNDAGRPQAAALPWSTAKPLAGAHTSDLATARTPPPAPPAPRMFGPDGIVYRNVGAAPSTVSALRRNPPPLVEALVQTPAEPEPEPAPVVRTDRPLTPEPVAAPKATVSQVHGKMIGPDGIEYRSVQHSH